MGQRPARGDGAPGAARAAIRLADRALPVARALLGVYRTPPPEGVRVATPAGAHYLIYSFAPRVRVLNGFIQALNGLYDFGKLASDPEGRALMAQGDAQARTELPHFDTGAWSRYSWPGPESDLGYHELLRGFLEGLCAREREAAAAPTPELPARRRALLRPGRAVHGLPARAPGARAAGRAPRQAPRAAAIRVPYTLSKVSTVTTLVTSGRAAGRRRARVRLGRGRHELAVHARAAPAPTRCASGPGPRGQRRAGHRRGARGR